MSDNNEVTRLRAIGRWLMAATHDQTQHCIPDVAPLSAMAVHLGSTGNLGKPYLHRAYTEEDTYYAGWMTRQDAKGRPG